MKVYRVSWEARDGDGHKGYGYFSSKRDTAKAIRDAAEMLEAQVEAVEVTLSKQGVLKALNSYGGHADNG